jgi:hypothetical protein
MLSTPQAHLLLPTPSLNNTSTSRARALSLSLSFFLSFYQVPVVFRPWRRGIIATVDCHGLRRGGQGRVLDTGRAVKRRDGGGGESISCCESGLCGIYIVDSLPKSVRGSHHPLSVNSDVAVNSVSGHATYP